MKKCLLVALMLVMPAFAHAQVHDEVQQEGVASHSEKILVDPADDEASRSLASSIGFLGFVHGYDEHECSRGWGSCSLIRNDRISGAWVLTAHHVVTAAALDVIWTNPICASMKVGFSMNSLSGDSDAIEVDMNNVYFHPIQDIAVMKLKRLAYKADGDLIPPAQFYTSPLQVKQIILMAGYGDTGDLSLGGPNGGGIYDGNARAARGYLWNIGFLGIYPTLGLLHSHGSPYENCPLQGIAAPGDSGGPALVETGSEYLVAGVVVSGRGTGVDTTTNFERVEYDPSFFAWLDNCISTGTPEHSLALQTPIDNLRAVVLGEDLHIGWLSSVDTDIRIELWKGGLFDRVIANATPNTGSYDWTTPGDLPPGADYRIRIATTDGAYADEGSSDLAFLIPIYLADMSTDPGWSFDGTQWAWGEPTGGTCDEGSDPVAGKTGASVIGYNLDGAHANLMTNAEYATTPLIDCSNSTVVHLVFQRWLGVAPTSEDKASISISNDGGESWNLIWENGPKTEHGGGWSRCDYDVSLWAAHQANVKVRWGIGPTNDTTALCGWNLDDVGIYGDFSGTDTSRILTTSVVGGHGSLGPASGSQTADTVVTLTAVPDEGYRVKAWTGTDDDASKTSTNTVTMSEDRTVTVEFEAVPPVADAGPDQNAASGQTVALDGTASSTAIGQPLTYAWAFVSKPEGSEAELSDPTVANPTFVADKAGVYTVQLVVGDGTSLSEPDTVAVAVTAPSIPCDIDGGGRVDAMDVQLVINSALQRLSAYDCDVDHDGRVDAKDVQLVINAVLGVK